MASYKLDKKLYSYRVSRQLLKDVEGFILRKAKEIGADLDPDPSAYTIEIKDRLGAQRLASIDDYHISQFPNDTESIELSYHSHRGPAFRFYLRLTRSAYYNRIQIELSGEAPREQVLGMWSSLQHLLENYKTRNYLFQLHPAIDGACMGAIIACIGAGIIVLLAGMQKVDEFLKTSGGFLLAFGVFAAAYFCGRYLYPYTVFDTPQNETRATIGAWYIGALATFLLFGVLATYFRQKYLGF